MKKFFTLFLFCLSIATTQAQIVITEIMYNNPGADDYEFIELYNNSDIEVDMTGWTMSSGVDFTFPNFLLPAGEYVIICTNSIAFDAAFGIAAFEWSTTTGVNNGGELIELSDNNGNIIDGVEYDDAFPWPTAPDGDGPSLVLCDFNSDNNDGANWGAATTSAGMPTGGDEFFMNPGAASDCAVGPVITFIGGGVTVNEADGTVDVDIAITSGDANATTVEVNIGMSSAQNGVDFTLNQPTIVTFTAGASDETQTITIGLIDDFEIESIENIALLLENPTNNANIDPTGDDYNINIIDNDAIASNALIITGVFDAQPGAAGTKGIELYALDNIPDLSLFGVGSANNGDGTDGIEVAFPSISVFAGDCIYVADDSTKFNDFFGFFPDFVGDAANINGDDAIELFENGIVIDVFGDINVDGSGTPWEYLDGWAYRNIATGPDGDVFVLDNWTFSGVDALQNVPNNMSADNPFPACSYDPNLPTSVVANDDGVSTDIDVAIDIEVFANDILPNGFSSLMVITDANSGTTNVLPSGMITYTPNPGFCGEDTFEYQVCDLMGCDMAIVTITIDCPVSYPAYTIDEIDNIDANGNPDSLGISMQLQGVVYGVDLQGQSDAILFTVIDNTGGIAVFSGNNFGYEVNEGDEIIMQGSIGAFSCLTQFTPDTLWMVSADNALVDPLVVTEINEETESELIRINNLNWVSTAATGASGWNVTVTDGVNEYVLRIDSDTDVTPELIEMASEGFDAIGIGGQFDSDGTCDGGYQFLPRYVEDILLLDNTIDRTLAEKIKFFPNPTADNLTIQSDIQLDNVLISNILGQTMLMDNLEDNQISVSHLPQGVYTITFQAGDKIWASEFVKL